MYGQATACACSQPPTRSQLRQAGQDLQELEDAGWVVSWPRSSPYYTPEVSRRSRMESVTAPSWTETVTAPRAQEEVPDGNRDGLPAAQEESSVSTHTEEASVEEAAAKAELLELAAYDLRVRLD